jgi:hypothetical protein
MATSGRAEAWRMKFRSTVDLPDPVTPAINR